MQSDCTLTDWFLKRIKNPFAEKEKKKKALPHCSGSFKTSHVATLIDRSDVPLYSHSILANYLERDKPTESQPVSRNVCGSDLILGFLRRQHRHRRKKKKGKNSNWRFLFQLPFFFPPCPSVLIFSISQIHHTPWKILVYIHCTGIWFIKSLNFITN